MLLAVSAGIALGTVPAEGIDPYSMKPAELQVSKEFPQAIADAVEVQGWRIFTYRNGLEDPICEVFWAKEVTGQESPSPPSSRKGKSLVLYSNLRPGALVGVIRLLPESRAEFREDFHDQKLSPGYYTMRYAPISDRDSNDFVLLSRVLDDSNPQRILSTADLSKLSRVASGTTEPAVMSLAPVDPHRGEYPDVIMADDGSCILQTKLHLKEQTGPVREVTFAIILARPPEEGDGS